jgi:CBS domain-containing protein
MHTLEASAPLFEMLVFMLERRVHHIPLVEGREILGVVTDTDILRHHLKSPFHLLKEIERSEDPAALIGYGNRLTALVEALFGSGLDPTQIGRLVATLNDAVVVRVIRRAEAELGPPPMPYAWIVFGSEGRREQALLTDQDNALVYAEASEEAEVYFGELSQRVVSGLVEASFPPCPGGFMATNWHKPLAEWERMFRGWIDEPEPEALLDAANFFDYRAVHGGLPLDTLDRILAEAGSNSLFLAQLARAGLRFRPPLGLFRQLKDEDGGIEVKKGGIMPIVSLARVYGLQADASLRSTLLRLSGAGEADLISDEDAEMLSDAFRFLFRIRLEHQLRTVRSGGSPTNRVPLEHLTAMERRHLKETFQLVRRSQDALAQRFDVDMLG